MNDPIRKQWLESRRTYLGGTDISAIVGLNPYSTPLNVYLSKRGEVEDTSGVKALMGTYLEPVVKRLFTEETGLQVFDAPEHVRHPEYDFIGGNPDGIVEGAGIIECKTYDFSTAADFGEPGTDQVPKQYFIQCQMYLGLCGESICYLAALHRTTGKFSIYHINFDEALYEMLVAEAVAFWNDHVLAEVEPEPRGGDMGILKERFPTDTGGFIVADAKMEGIAEKMRDLQRQIKPLEKEYEDLKAYFVARMGDDSLCETMIGPFTYRKSKDTTGVNWQEAFKTAAVSLDKAVAEEIINLNTGVTKKGSRRFLTPFSKDKD